MKIAWEIIAAEVKHKSDETAERLKEKLIRNKQAFNQTVYEYLEETRLSFRELLRIWKPQKTVLIDFENNTVIKYFVRGIRDDNFRRNVQQYIDSKNITTFDLLYNFINKIKKEDDEAAEHKGDVLNDGIALVAKNKISELETQVSWLMNTVGSPNPTKAPQNSRPIKNFSEDPNYAEDRGTLRISNIPNDISEKQLQSVFTNIAPVAKCSILNNPMGRSTRVDFVTFKNPDDTRKWLMLKKGVDLKGRRFAISQNYRKSNVSGLVAAGEDHVDYAFVDLSENTLNTGSRYRI